MNLIGLRPSIEKAANKAGAHVAAFIVHLACLKHLFEYGWKGQEMMVGYLVQFYTVACWAKYTIVCRFWLGRQNKYESDRHVVVGWREMGGHLDGSCWS